MTIVFRKLAVPVAWAGLTLIATYLVFLGGGFPAIYSIPLRLVNEALLVVIIGAFLLAAAVRPGLLPRSSLAVPILLALAALVVATLASEWPRFGWEIVLGAAGAALLYLLLVRILSIAELRSRLRFTVAVVTVAVAVAYLVQVGILWGRWYAVTGASGLPPLRPATANLTLGTPSIVAGVLLMLGPLVVVWLIEAGRRRTAIAAIVLVFAAIVVSGSRSAWIGALLAAVLAVTAAALSAPVRRRLRDAMTSVDRRIVLLIATGGIVLVAVLGPALVARFVQSGAEVRFNLWLPSIAMFLSDPLTGTGPGTWAFAWWHHLPPGDNPIVVAHAHNVVLQIAAELGLVGMGAAAVFALGVVRLLRRAAGSLEASEIAAITLALVALVGQCLFDNFADLPVIVVGVAYLLAWVESAIPSPAIGSPVSRGARAVPAGLLAGLIVVSIGVLWPWSLAAWSYLDGIGRFNAGDRVGAIAAYADAVSADPALPPYRSALAVTLAIDGRIDEAIAEALAAARLTDDPFLWTDAAVLTAERDSVAALGAAAHAVRDGAVDPSLYLNLGRVHELAGDRSGTTDAWATLLALNPLAAASGFWRSPDRIVPADALFATVDAWFGNALARSQFWAATGDLAKARAALAEAPATPAIIAQGLLIDALSGDAAAYDRLADFARENPQDLDVVGAAGRAAYLTGQPDASRYDEWMVLIFNSTAYLVHPEVIVGEGTAEATRYVTIGFGVDEQVYLRNGAPGSMPGTLGIGFR
jgi:O-antigen ligase